MLNVLVLMAGRGTHFAGTRHKCPKPMIEVVPGRRMIEFVVRYLTPSEPHRFVFVCLESDVRDLKLGQFFRSLTKRFVIVTTRRVTRGPACSALLAAREIDDDEVLVAYCDDYLDIRIDGVLELWRSRHADGGLLLYPSKRAHDSYAITDRRGNVLRTAEKARISRHATAGLYYFKSGKEFVRCARRMIRNNLRADGEFFVSTVYNELISANRTVVASRIPARVNCSMGTPEELERFVHRLRGGRLRRCLT